MCASSPSLGSVGRARGRAPDGAVLPWMGLVLALLVIGCGGEGTHASPAPGAAFRDAFTAHLPPSARPAASGAPGASATSGAPGEASASTGAASRSGRGAARSRGPFRAGTFNAGLAVGILAHADARAEPVVKALAEEPLDLLCVQEFWLEEHWHQLTNATAERLPNTHHLAPDPGGTALCAPEDLGRLAVCATPCGGARSDAARCVLERCMHVLPTVSGGCLSCLGRDPRRSFTEFAQSCVDGAAAASAKAVKRGAREVRDARLTAQTFYGYGGSFGTGLLTSAPITARDAYVFPSALARRGVLYARLDAPIGPVHAFCTHLTAEVGGVPHPAGGSWTADQRREIEALLAYVERKVPRGEPIVLLGDLNTGPAAAPSVSARLPGHFQRLIAWGFVDPSGVSGPPNCTYCSDNPLSGGQGTRGSLIDHVLLRGLSGASHRDLLRRPLDVQVRGKRVRTGFSDHYGVVVDITPEGG
ncbi:endonuclease/exonuclease/phosphatase family protein [Chondromyces apiculatus]|nr:endonuclease/exonuclease/phosphatase family protein [Chondromyces apiculatus]